MAKKKKVLPVFEKITITDIAAEGKAIAKVDNMVVFTSYVVPGDVVDLQVTRKKNSYMEARVLRIHEYSAVRAVPFCEHYGICGGCKWQVLPYEAQLQYKQKQVVDNLTRIGKIKSLLNSPPEDLDESKPKGFYPIIASQKTIFYRNKLEFTFSNKRWKTQEEISSDKQFDDLNALGFHIPKMFDKILDIKKCWLQDDISNRIRLAIKDFAIKNNYPFFDLRMQEGFLRNIIIRTSTTGDLMLIIVFFYEDKEKQNALLQHVEDLFPEITSLLYIINNKANDTINDREVFVHKGKDHIFEEMEGLKFKIGAKSFYQTNSEQAYELYKKTREFCGLTGNELVYDLYTGTGAIANFVARQAKKVIGIEYLPEAIEDAKINAIHNRLDNTLFFAGDMKNILNEAFINQHGRPDVIITDPPRDGMHADVVKAILFAAPKRIVYVSCNPATQARDLALLNEKYEVKAVQPVDMFPHTHHVENIVLLVLNRDLQD